MVKALEPYTHRACSWSDSNEADPFNDSVTGLGYHGEADRDVRALTGFRARACLSDGERPFGENPINIFGHPPSNLVDRPDARDDLAAEQSEFLDRGGRIR